MDKSFNKMSVRFDMVREGDDFLQPVADVRFLCRLTDMEKSYWLAPRADFRYATTQIRADQLAGVRFRPNCPFVIPLFGASATHHSSWLSSFGEVEGLFKLDSVSHTQLSKTEVRGWVETKGKSVLRISFDNGAGLKRMSVTGYPVHPRLSYENPDSTLGWLFKSDSEWEKFGENYVPVRVDYKSRVGVPGKMKCFESATVIRWRKLEDVDMGVLDEKKLANEANSLHQNFIGK